mgnify:FL=1
MSINPEEGFLTQATEGSGNYSMEAIIVVAPSAGSNVITMYNVEQFMDKGEYVSSEMMRKVRADSPSNVEIAAEAPGGRSHTQNQRTRDAVPLHRQPLATVRWRVGPRRLHPRRSADVAVQGMAHLRPCDAVWQEWLRTRVVRYSSGRVHLV